MQTIAIIQSWNLDHVLYILSLSSDEVLSVFGNSWLLCRQAAGQAPGDEDARCGSSTWWCLPSRCDDANGQSKLREFDLTLKSTLAGTRCGWNSSGVGVTLAVLDVSIHSSLPYIVQKQSEWRYNSYLVLSKTYVLPPRSLQGHLSHVHNTPPPPPSPTLPAHSYPILPYLSSPTLTLSPSVQTSCCTTNKDMYTSRTNLCFVSILAWQWGSAFGGLCQSEPESCDFREIASQEDFRETGSQENWFFTQYISYLQAREVIVNVSAYFESCRLIPTCNRLYVDMYRYERNGQDDAAARTTSNYGQPIRRIQPNGLGQAVNQISFTFTPSGNFSGFYIGVRATGTCASIRRLQVYYNSFQPFAPSSVICPETGLPPQDTTIQVNCSCPANSARTSSNLTLTCSSDGTCTGNSSCQCLEGYRQLPRQCEGTYATSKFITVAMGIARSCHENATGTYFCMH